MSAAVGQLSKDKPNSRRKMIAAIQIQWGQLRPDLDGEELRDERLAYITSILKLKEPLASLKDLTNYQMSRVLQCFDGLRRAPALPGTQVIAQPTTGGAEVVHLATAQQVYTINKLLDFLGWQPESRARFLKARFKRESPVHLLPRQAQSLTRILLNIACQQELKTRGFRKVTRAQIAMHIPALKRKLGIDRGKTHPAEGSEECHDSLITLTENSAS